MNEQRISLTRIVAINWYGFRQIIDLTGHSLIAGAFGSGKTVLLDLMQYVLLGQHWRPNRAAAGNARSRSLVSYCLCDTNTLRNGEPHYTRTSGASIIGLEFTWPAEKPDETPRRETWGMRIEFSSATAESRLTYFCVPERVEWSMLAPEGRLHDEDSFRTWLRRDYGRDAIFSRQQEYLAEMASPNHLYFDGDQFHRTLPKAIAFEPEEDVEKFIREFILEENPVDVRDVRAAVGAYRETQSRIEKQENEAEMLRKVCTAHDQYEEARIDAGVYHHTARAVLHAQTRERLERFNEDLNTLRRDNEDDITKIAAFRARLDEVVQTIEATRLEVSGDPEAKKLEALQRERLELHGEIQRIEEARAVVRERFSTLRQRWVVWLKNGRDVAGRDERTARLLDILEVDAKLLESLADPDEAAGLGALPKLAEAFNDRWREAAQVKQKVDEAITEQQARLRQLASDLESLERREAPGSFPVFRAIRDNLGGRAEQLARLIEVKPEAERWWPALELFLGRQRWVVVVNKPDYREALEVLRQTAPGRESESLLNPFETQNLRNDVKPGSLATKVTVSDPVAAGYVNYLLGDVACVETIKEMDESPAGRAITPDGVFKQVPVRRRLHPGKEIQLTLGARGLERLRASREKEQVEARREYERLSTIASDLNAWIDFGRKAGLGDARLPDRTEDLPKLAEKWARWRSMGETIELLRTPERESRLERLHEHEKERRKLDGDMRVIEERLKGFTQAEARLISQAEAAQEECKCNEQELLQLRSLLPASIPSEKLDAALAAIVAQYPVWQERQYAAQQAASKAEVRSREALAARNIARRELIESDHQQEEKMRHPEYRHDFDADDPTNERWANRLRQLDEVELPKFRALAAERRKDWEVRLRESVLDRLKERLDKATQDVRMLREYLSRDVGRYRYMISQKREPAFSAIWSLLDSGFEPTDELLQASRSPEVLTALDELMRAVEAAGEGDERARRLLDYRYYHRYDLTMVPVDNPSAPAISLGRSGRSLSGGENQAPFFLSMLAAFRRVYDLGSHRSRHIGLVVMDEAFSKLSGDGVENCLDLARNFQLQLVMAFPIDRLGVMAPYAETVIICRKEEQRDSHGFISRVDNIPQRLSVTEALDSLT